MPYTPARYALFAILTAAPMAAATFNVTSTVDAHDTNPGNGVCGANVGGSNQACTLRAALEETNGLAGPDIVNVPAGFYVLSLGYLSVTDSVQVIGDEVSPPTVDGQFASIVFVVDGSRRTFQVHVEFHYLTIRNGYALSGSGGGVFNNRARLLIRRCRLNSNRADTGGGGLHNNSGGTVEIEETTVSSNGHKVGGDALPQRGGGIQNNGVLYVSKSTISTNVAGRAGGIFNGGSGILIMRNSTVSANTADIDTGGIMNGRDAYLNNSTVAFNKAQIKPSIFTPNDPNAAGGVYGGNFWIANTIIANNTNGPNAGFGTNLDCTGNINSAGYNLVYDAAGCTIVGDLAGNLVGQDPMLQGLGFYSGRTMSHALPAGSVAVNAGNPGATDALGNHCEPVDQRNRTRGVGPGVGRCDIGANERNAAPGGLASPPRP
jgi:large repetitive protein